MGDGGLARWLGVAAVVHVAGLVWAGSVEAKPPRGAPLDRMIASIEAATEPAAAAVAKAPPPPPATPSRLADAPGRSPQGVTAPPVPRPPAPQPAPTTPDVRDKIAAHLSGALSAVAAQAAKILASTEGDGPPMASGNAASAYGMVAGNGAGTSPTFDPRAGLRGRPGGTGAPVPEPPDRSRGASVNKGYDTDCEFPAEADRVQHGWADLVATVRADGRASRVRLVADSGYGFGPRAQQCAMRFRYQTALDRNGLPIEHDTPPFRYGFHR
jgi:protein TonB